MIYALYKDGELVNTIVASAAFVDTYASDMGYTYEAVPEPKVIDPEPTTEELLLEIAADHEYRISLQEMGLTEADLL